MNAAQNVGTEMNWLLVSKFSRLPFSIVANTQGIAGGAAADPQT
jgi:hypothetical protein